MPSSFMAAALANKARRAARLIGRVGHLDVVRLVPAHHLIASDSLQDGVHDRPLGSGQPPALFGFFRGELHDLCETGVKVQATA